jgi:hypothetical protein
MAQMELTPEGVSTTINVHFWFSMAESRDRSFSNSSATLLRSAADTRARSAIKNAHLATTALKNPTSNTTPAITPMIQPEGQIA